MDDDDKPVLSGPTGEWVLIGLPPRGGGKAIGPFASADDARAACNELGLPPGIEWNVLPLFEPW